MSCCFRSSPCSPCAARCAAFSTKWRGLWGSLSRVGILGGVWLAGRYYGELGRIFSQYTTSQWVYIVAYVLILCMVMFVISMISRALHSFLKMAYADWINHLAGAAVGGLKGFLICAVMVTLLTYFINDADFIKKSRMIQPIKETIVVFKQFLPEQYRK